MFEQIKEDLTQNHIVQYVFILLQQIKEKTFEDNKDIKFKIRNNIFFICPKNKMLEEIKIQKRQEYFHVEIKNNKQFYIDSFMVKDGDDFSLASILLKNTINIDKKIFYCIVLFSFEPNLINITFEQENTLDSMKYLYYSFIFVNDFSIEKDSNNNNNNNQQEKMFNEYKEITHLFKSMKNSDTDMNKHILECFFYKNKYKLNKTDKELIYLSTDLNLDKSNVLEKFSINLSTIMN